MGKANLKQWILERADEEPIEAVVIGEMGWGDFASERVPNYDIMPKGKLLTWEQAAPFLDYEFNDGFGAPGCNAIWAWTPTMVIAIAQYDGSTWPYAVPRHPVDAMPTMEGR